MNIIGFDDFGSDDNEPAPPQHPFLLLKRGDVFVVGKSAWVVEGPPQEIGCHWRQVRRTNRKNKWSWAVFDGDIIHFHDTGIDNSATLGPEFDSGTFGGLK